jgi:hypothetical protein
MATETLSEFGADEGSGLARSPSFPFIDLKAAVQRAHQFYEAEKRNAAAPAVAVGHWNYTPKSSGGRQTLAALRAYGLLAGKERVALTPRALKIVVPGAVDRTKALREAALAPPEFKRLWDEHGQELPSDQSLRHELLTERGYNENSVENFINNYKVTVAFAQLRDTPDPPFDEGDLPTTLTPQGVGTHAPTISSSPSAVSPSAFGRPIPSSLDALVTEIPPITFPLPRGNVIEIRLKARVTQEEFEQITQLWRLLGPSLVERQDSKSPANGGD